MPVTTNLLQPKRFLIVGANRSGTTYINRAIASHPQISGAPRELAIWPLFVTGANAFVKGNYHFARRRASTRSLFDTVCDRDSHPEVRALGGKIAIYEEIEAMDFVCGVRECFEDLLIIRVHRENLVARFASYMVAESSKKWWLSPCDKRTLERQSLDIDTFRVYLEVDRAKASVFDALYRTHQVVDLHFEDLQDPNWIVPVHEQLGVDPLKPPVSRRSTPPLETWVDNLEELRELAQHAPPRRDMEAEIDQHRLLQRQRAKPYEVLSQAQFHMKAGEPWRARQALMPSFWRRLAPDQLGEACSLLLSALKTIGSLKLAETTIQELPPGLRESAPLLAVRAHYEAELGDTDRAMAFIRRAQDSSTDGNTSRFIGEVLQHVKAAPKRVAPSPKVGTRRFVVLAPQWSGAEALVTALAAQPDLQMLTDELRPWPLLRRGLAVYSTSTLDQTQRLRWVQAAFDALAPWKGGVHGRGLHIALHSDRDAMDAVAGLRESLPGALVIRIHRRDLVARFAEQERPSHRLDAKAFAQFVAEQRRLEASLDLLDTSHDVIRVAHKNLVAWHGFSNIARAFGLAATELSKPRREPPRPVAEVVANLEELRAIERAAAPVDMADEVRRQIKNTPAVDPLRDHLFQAELYLSEHRLEDAGREAVSALRRQDSVGSPAATIGFDLLERIWQLRGDGSLAQTEFAELEALHQDDARLQHLRGVLTTLPPT